MWALVAHFLELIHEAGHDADGMLERRVQELAPNGRQRLRAALGVAA